MTAEQLGLWGESARELPATGAVLALVDQGRYAVLAGTTDIVWIDGHGNWCFRDVPGEHLAALAALRQQGVLTVGSRVRSVRLADRPVEVRPLEMSRP